MDSHMEEIKGAKKPIYVGRKGHTKSPKRVMYSSKQEKQGKYGIV